MDHSRERNRSLRPLLVGSLAVLCALLAWGWNSAFANPAFDDDLTIEVYGRVDSFPAGLVGTWVVDGVTYAANGSTEFEQEDGAFAVGKCVKVEYFIGTSPRLMREVETENESDCGGGSTSTPDASGTSTVSATPDASETPGATPSPSRTPDDDDGDDDDDDDDRKVKGIVESMPDAGLIGTWMINGVVYVTNAGTEFEQDEGPFAVGACVEAEFIGESAPFTIVEIETEDGDDCAGNGTPGAPSTPTGEIELYGSIDSFPADLVGAWVIDGVSYTATASTEFERDYGSFAVGACVKIHANPSTSPATLREIETERDYHCGGSDGDDDGGDDDDDRGGDSEIYGVLQSFPEGLIGTWNVAGMSFVADAGTEFEQDDGAFAVGATVKVEFVVQDGVNRATEIETKFASDDDDDGGDDDSFEGEDGHTYGVIDSFPAGLVGTWVVSGIEYTAGEFTEFEQDDGPFAVGERVKVEYHVTSDGTRAAEEIETTDDNGGVSQGTHFILFGYVNAMPASGFVGTWVVGSNTFVATNDTIFAETDGLLGLGAYVGVEYTLNNGNKVIYKLETHVPPGAGDNVLIAPLQSVDDVRAAQVTANSQWTIGGRSYTITPATAINDRSSPIAVGETVFVNSFTDDSGNEIATQVAGVSLSSRVLLPIVAR